jgi:hypothetical protein
MKWLKWLTGGLILILLVVGFALVHFYTDLKNTRDELAALKSQVELNSQASQKTLDSMKSDNSQVETQLTTARGYLENTLSELASVQSQLDLYKSTWGSVDANGVKPPYGPKSQLTNNSSAANPTWAQLQNFILTDKTDQNAYVTGVYECGDFARDVHDNAEKAGIKCGWVYIQFADDTAHACDAFVTSDYGLVFIDCTAPLPAGLPNNDKIVSLNLGQQYIPASLFSDSAFGSMGTIQDVQIYW